MCPDGFVISPNPGPHLRVGVGDASEGHTPAETLTLGSREARLPLLLAGPTSENHFRVTACRRLEALVTEERWRGW